MALGRELGDLRGMATALIAVAQTEGATRGAEMAREAVAAFRELEDAWGIATSLEGSGGS
ncbi:MAG: hypothetical protein ACRDHS_14295 [Actinomycetota bacterium]